MEERHQILQQTRDMLAQMDAELGSGLAVMKRIADDMGAARREDDEATNKKNDTMAAARQDDDEATNNKNDTLAAARWDDDKTTKKEDDTMTAARYHEGTTETKKRRRSGIPVCDGKGDPKKQTDGQSQTNKETGTPTTVARRR